MTESFVNYCKSADSLCDRWLPAFLLPSKSIPFVKFSESRSGVVDERCQEKIYQIFLDVPLEDILFGSSDKIKGFTQDEAIDFKKKFRILRSTSENVTFVHSDMPDKIFKKTFVSICSEFTKYPGFDCSIGPFRMTYHGVRESEEGRVNMAERARVAKKNNGLDLIEIPKKQIARLSKQKGYSQIAVIDKLDLARDTLPRLNRLSAFKAFKIFSQVFTLIKDTGLIDVSFLDGNISFLKNENRVAFIDTESWSVDGLQGKGTPDYYAYQFNIDLSEIRTSNRNIVLTGGPRNAEIALGLAVVSQLSNETAPHLDFKTSLAMKAAHFAVRAKGYLEIAGNFLTAWNNRLILPTALILGVATSVYRYSNLA